MEKEKRARIRSTIDFVLGDFDNDIEKPVGKSLTVPDDAMSIQQMLLRQAGGIPVRVHEGGYDSDVDFDSPDLEKLRDSDLIDKAEFSKDLGSRMNALDDDIRSKRKAAKEAADKKDFDEKVDAEIKKRAKAAPSSEAGAEKGGAK